WIGCGIRDDQRRALQDRMCAERLFARRFLHVQPDARLEPLAILVDQREYGNGHAQQAARQPRDLIEDRFRGSVQNLEGPEQFLAFKLIGWNKGCGHAADAMSMEHRQENGMPLLYQTATRRHL